MSTPLRFVNRLIEETGGDVEWHPAADGFQALLPEEVRQELELPDQLVTIRDGTDADEEQRTFPVGFGTELLERATKMAMERGRTAAVRMPPVATKKQVSSDLPRHYDALNATFQTEGVQESWRDYWIWSLATVAEADERREGQYRVCVSSDRVECPGLVHLILGQALDPVDLPPEADDRLGKELGALYLVAVDRALRRLRQELPEFAQGVARRHGRDIRSIKAYFEDLRREMEEEIQRHSLEGEALQIRREKQAQLSSEESRKLSVLEEKYRLRVTIRPWALLLARMPVKHCDLLVKRRKGERRISVVHNLLSKRFEPLACEACGADTYELGFCDHKLHLLCRTCLSGCGGRGLRDCPRCSGRRPPSSTAEVIERLDLEDKGA